jgi:ankyrin repeat protein
LLLVLSAAGANLGPDLLAAAKKGQTVRVQALLAQGVPVESADKDGRTALMLAAQHGHSDTVKALLAGGARPETRDRSGFAAYGLALLSSGSGRDDVLQLLPHPPTVRLLLNATLVAENLYSSCFLTPQGLAAHVRALQPAVRLVSAIRQAAAAISAPVELVAADGDATLTLRVRPRAVCVQQEAGDKLNLEVDASLSFNGEAAPLWEKTVGGGFKGMREQIINSAAQYEPVLDAWAKKHAPEIYQGTLEALLKR